MVINEDNLSSEEKIKQLQEFEKNKHKELEEKKSELENKKKELEELETKSKREISDARKDIEEEIEELALDEKQRFEELEEIRRRREEETASLEEAIEEEEKKGRTVGVPRQRAYGEIFEEILEGKPNFYDLTNYNVMNRLEEIASQAGNRALTKAEKDFVELVHYHAERIGRDDFYKDKDEGNYLARELAKADHINKLAKDANKMTRDYEV